MNEAHFVIHAKPIGIVSPEGIIDRANSPAGMPPIANAVNVVKWWLMKLR
jgi:hypothetical protein